MGRIHDVVRAVTALQKATHAVKVIQAWELGGAAGQDTMRVTLVAGIEKQLIVRRVEDVVEGDS